MAVIVDTTNIVQTGFDLGGVSMTLLREIAQERNQRLVLPDVVLNELRSKRIEAVRRDLQAFQNSLSRIRGFAEIPHIEVPSLDVVVERWLAQLEGFFEIEPVTGEEAKAALVREAAGEAPTVQKHGARDASIWIVAKRLHLEGAEDTYFVSHNTKDFGDPEYPERLHPDLVAELGARASEFHYLQAIDDVLNAMATPLEIQLDVPALENPAAVGAVQGWVQLHPGRKAVDWWKEAGFDTPPTSIVVHPDIEAIPAAVLSSTTYEVEGRRVMVILSTWQLSYAVLMYPEEMGPFSVIGDLRVQLLLRDLEGGGQAAEVLDASDVSLTIYWGS